MKKVFKDIAKVLHQKDPTASFSIEFWDGDSIIIGNNPRFILKLKSLKGAKKILNDGYLGLGESYMKGDVEIENDLQELLRIGISIDFDKINSPSLQKIRFFILALLHCNTLRNSKKIFLTTTIKATTSMLFILIKQ